MKQTLNEAFEEVELERDIQDKVIHNSLIDLVQEVLEESLE